VHGHFGHRKLLAIESEKQYPAFSHRDGGIHDWKPGTGKSISSPCISVISAPSLRTSNGWANGTHSCPSRTIFSRRGTINPQERTAYSSLGIAPCPSSTAFRSYSKTSSPCTLVFMPMDSRSLGQSIAIGARTVLPRRSPDVHTKILQAAISF